jgi:molybdopterin molybdotransferase
MEREPPELRSVVPRDRHAVAVASGRSLVQFPRAGYRSSVISVTEALETILDATPVLGVERVALLDALGRVAAEDVRSERAVPAADNSAMDGFAVRGADVATAPARLRIVGMAPAGSLLSGRVEAGTAARIYTGSIIPEGADTVVRVEDTESADGVVTVRVPIKPGANVRPRGEDILPGATVLARGTRLGPADIGVLASVGHAEIAVRKRPRVAIVSTGAELVEIDETPGPAQVVNSNAYALAAAVEEAGCTPILHPIVRDRFEDIRTRFEEAATADVVLSTGGVSVGDFDFVRDALDALGVVRRFWKVAQKPGKPLTFGTIGERLFFGLPGNPVSALVCFAVYARPALRKLAGHRAIHYPVVQAELTNTMKKATNLTEFVRVRLEREGGGWMATAGMAQGSGVQTSLSAGAGLLVGPAALTQLDAGKVFPVIVVDGTSFATERPCFSA